MSASREILTSAVASATQLSEVNARVNRKVRDNLWRDVPLFSIYGLLNNGLICVVYGAAKDVVIEFGLPNLATLPTTISVLAAIAGPTVLMLPPMKRLGFRTKVAVSITLGVAGTLLMAGAVFFLGSPKKKEGEDREASVLGFIAAMFAVLLLSLQQSLGENIACVRFQRCSKIAFSMWGAGTGLAGIIPPLLYGLIKTWPLALRFLMMLPFFVFYAGTCIFVYSASRRDAVRSFVQDYVVTTEEIFEDEDVKQLHRERSASQDHQLVGMSLEVGGSSTSVTETRSAFAAPNQYGYALYIGFIYCATYGLEYFVQPTCLSAATQCKGLDSYYLGSVIAYNVGVTVSRSSIAIFEFPHLWLLGTLQTINVIGWTLEVELHFLARIISSDVVASEVVGTVLWYGWMVWVGFMGGGVYANCLRQYHCSPNVPAGKRDQFINMAFSLGNVVILASTLLGLLLNSTIWTEERMKRTCPVQLA